MVGPTFAGHDESNTIAVGVIQNRRVARAAPFVWRLCNGRKLSTALVAHCVARYDMAANGGAGGWIVLTPTWSDINGPLTITSSSANALVVGPAGTTNPTLQVDASTASAATGIKIKSASAGTGVAVSV